MANPFYNHTDGVPANQTRGVSALIRNEFDLIAAGFDLVAPITSPTFLGVPAGPTAAPGTSTTQLATTAFVIAQGLTSALPGQAGNAGKYITTNGVVASWGDLIGVTQATSDNSTNVATTAYVVNRIAQDAPTKTGTGASGSWNITAATATNLAGGSNGQIVYQTGAGTTGFVAVGAAGQILLSNGAAAPTWTSTVAVTAGGTGSATAAGARSNLGAAASGANNDITSLTGLTSAIYATGQCKLSLSAGSLKLLPFNGNSLIVNGRSCTVPDAGVTLAATGLQPLFAITNRAITSNVATLTHAALAAAIPIGTNIGVRDVGGATAYNGAKVVTASSTTTTSYAAVAANEATTADTNGRVMPIYEIYATAAAGAVNALEASFTAHSTSTTAGNKGVEIKTGDDTRSLVGMAALIAGPNFSDTAAQRFVRSWFNDSGVELEGTAVSNTTASASFVEISSSGRVELIAWANERMDMKSNSYGFTNSSNNSAYAGIGYNGPTVATGEFIRADVANSYVGMSHASTRVLTEGYLFLTPCITATLTFTATATSQLRGNTLR